MGLEKTGAGKEAQIEMDYVVCSLCCWDCYFLAKRRGKDEGNMASRQGEEEVSLSSTDYYGVLTC